jgi:hypothetical protein
VTRVTQKELDIDESDFWNELYKDIPEPLQSGEKTVNMMIEETGKEMNHHSMDKQIKKWVSDGKLICVGNRITVGGYRAKAYKLVV